MTTTPTPLVKLGARPPLELMSSSAFLLKRLGYGIKARSFEAFEAAGESPYHHAVLAVLDENAVETQAAIADALGYDRSWLVGLLDELEQDDLIERRRDPSDRRRHVVSLKPAGKKKLAKLRAIAEEVEKEYFAPLEPGQRQALHALLMELAAHHDPRCVPSDFA